MTHATCAGQGGLAGLGVSGQRRSETATRRDNTYCQAMSLSEPDYPTCSTILLFTLLFACSRHR